jgi:hypothetical protein
MGEWMYRYIFEVTVFYKIIIEATEGSAVTEGMRHRPIISTVCRRFQHRIRDPVLRIPDVIMTVKIYGSKDSS